MQHLKAMSRLYSMKKSIIVFEEQPNKSDATSDRRGKKVTKKENFHLLTSGRGVSEIAVEKPNLRSAFDILDNDVDGDLRAFYIGISVSDDNVIGSIISATVSNRNGFGGGDGRMRRKKNGDGPNDLKVYLDWAGGPYMDTYNYKGNYAYQIKDAFFSVLNMDPFTKFTNAKDSVLNFMSLNVGFIVVYYLDSLQLEPSLVQACD